MTWHFHRWGKLWSPQLGFNIEWWHDDVTPSWSLSFHVWLIASFGFDIGRTPMTPERQAPAGFTSGFIRGYLIGNIVGWPLLVAALAWAWFR